MRTRRVHKYLFESSEDHLGAGDVLLGVGEVHVQGVGAPGDSLVLIGLEKIRLIPTTLN